MKRSLIILAVFTLLLQNNSKATDLRGGVISVKYVSGLTYEIVLELYSHTLG